MKTLYRSCVCLLLFSFGTILFAQNDAAPVPTPVEVEAEDGLILRGDLYRPETIPAVGAPALLLMHQNQSSRAGYSRILPDLLAAGYIVLNVDLRGHGETGGRADWTLAQGDTLVWLAWLQAQEGVNPAQIAIMGASIGSNLALVGCAAFEGCVTAVALSPGLDYFGVQPQNAVVEGLDDRSALLIATQFDSASAVAVRTFFAAAEGHISAQVFSSGSHGTGLFSTTRERNRVLPNILLWLAQELPQDE